MDEFLFHPMLVHFPIALFFFEFFILVLLALKSDASYLRFARLTFWTAYLAAGIAILAGLSDSGFQITAMVRNHFFAAVSVFCVVTVRAVLWTRVATFSERVLKIQLGTSMLALALITLTAHLGAQMVYHF